MAARDAPQKYMRHTEEYPIHRKGIFLEQSPKWDQYVYGTDASGGRYTRDPRLRNVVAAKQTPTGLEKAGVLSGVLPQSTVSAGESEALIQLLKCLDVQVDVTSDTKVALRQLRSWNFGVQTYLSWSQVWEK